MKFTYHCNACEATNPCVLSYDIPTGTLVPSLCPFNGKARWSLQDEEVIEVDKRIKTEEEIVE